MLRLAARANSSALLNLRKPPPEHPRYRSWFMDTLWAVQKAGISQKRVRTVGPFIILLWLPEGAACGALTSSSVPWQPHVSVLSFLLHMPVNSLSSTRNKVEHTTLCPIRGFSCHVFLPGDVDPRHGQGKSARASADHKWEAVDGGDKEEGNYKLDTPLQQGRQQSYTVRSSICCQATSVQIKCEKALQKNECVVWYESPSHIGVTLAQP